MAHIPETINQAVINDLEAMENSRNYWKSKALQYKMDLHGAQKGIRRLKVKNIKLKPDNEVAERGRNKSYHIGFDRGMAQSKRELESWQEKCEILSKEVDRLQKRIPVVQEEAYGAGYTKAKKEEIELANLHG